MSVGIDPDDDRSGIARAPGWPGTTGPERRGRERTDRETVAAVDEIDGRPHLVVADVERDDAWVAVTEDAAVPVADWE